MAGAITPLKVRVLVLAWSSVEQASNHTWNGGMVGASTELHRHSDNVNYCIDNVWMYACQPSIHLTKSSYVNISFSSQVFQEVAKTIQGKGLAEGLQTRPQRT